MHRYWTFCYLQSFHAYYYLFIPMLINLPLWKRGNAEKLEIPSQTLHGFKILFSLIVHSLYDLSYHMHATSKEKKKKKGDRVHKQTFYFIIIICTARTLQRGKHDKLYLSHQTVHCTWLLGSSLVELFLK
jgi:hypothetical protein